MMPSRLRDCPPRFLFGLAFVTVAGVVLRLWYQWGRPFVGDEVGTIFWAKRDFGFILTSVVEPWLQMNAFVAMTKGLAEASGWNPWVMNLPTLVAGVALIPLTAAVGVRVASPMVALVAAAFAAGNPYLLLWSVTMRAYALLLVGLLVALLGALDWTRFGRWRDGVVCAVGLALALLMHPNALYSAVALVPVVAVPWWRERRAPTSLLVPLAAAAAVVALFYRPLLPGLQAYTGRGAATPPTTMAWVPWAAGEWFGWGWLVLPSLAALGLGLRATVDAPRLRALLWMIVVPPVLASWAGLSGFPWAMARYLVAIVPPLLVVMAAGVVTLPRAARPLAVVVILATWVPQIAAMDREKRRYPWPRAAAYIAATTTPADVLVAADDALAHTALHTTASLPADGAAFGTVTAFLASAPPARLVVVQAGEPIPTRTRQRRFRHLQVITYAGDARTDVAAAALDDLERWLGDRIDPALTGPYKLVLELRAALGRGDPDGRWTRAYYECRMRTEKQRFLPPQYLGVAR
jgi:hypothetical protein